MNLKFNSRHNRLALNVVTEFAKSGAGAAIGLMRRGSQKSLAAGPFAAAALSGIKGGAVAGAVSAVGSVALRSLREKRRSSKEALLDLANEGFAEIVCGGASALAAAGGALIANKIVVTAGITGVKGSALLIGVPLTSAVLTTLIVRNIYDRKVSIRFDSTGVAPAPCV